MTENHFGQEAFVPVHSKEAVQEHGSAQYEEILDRNESTLTELKNEVSGESQEEEVVTPITRKDVDSLERLHPLD